MCEESRVFSFDREQNSTSYCAREIKFEEILVIVICIMYEFGYSCMMCTKFWQI